MQAPASKNRAMHRTILAATLWLAALTPTAPATDQPSFVWLVSEDNSKHHLKLFDPHGADTPRIEALARSGIVFDRAFSCGAVCSVARTTLITGSYAPRIGTLFHRKEITVPMPEGLRMFPAYLREAGYYTANKSKKDYNAAEAPDVWDESSNRATWRKRRDGQPFFFMQSFSVSHESSLHFSKEVMLNEESRTDPALLVVPPMHPDTPTFRYTYARYHDRIRQMDEQIGQVVDELDKDGLLDNTFIFYFGDHGGVLPGSKGYAYETGLHVPLVVRIPDRWKHLVDASPGSRTSGFVSFIDFAPTLLHLAGLKVPSAMDGTPFLGEGIRGEDLARRDEVFGYADRFDEKYDMVRTLRKGRFKYMRSYQPFNFDGLQNNYRYIMLAYQEWRDLYRAGKLNESQGAFFKARAPEALYDVESDPYEMRNLAGDAAHAETLRDVRARLTAWVKGMPDLGFYPENHLAVEAFDNPVAFGRSHREAMARLVDIADLSLVPFDTAHDPLEKALASEDPWERYWALIVCSGHGRDASPFMPRAVEMAEGDPERLVRVRAAEFLGLTGAADPRPAILKALAETESPIEAAMILNTLVLLRDGDPGYEFNMTRAMIGTPGQGQNSVARRLEYLGTEKAE